jgi:acetyltransferase-like isoleucine patch superfamily enzyme
MPGGWSKADGMMQRRNSVVQQAQRLIRRYLWGMDIHASAWIAASALIDRTWPRGIHIGADCVVGEEVVILTHDLTRGLYVDTIIGDRTVIGPRAIILPGVLVNRDVPDGHVAQGNPAVATPR